MISFAPNLQNGGATADGIALFNVLASEITSTTVPIDAVVYGTNNSNGLMDETGVANAPDVPRAGAGDSVERTDLTGSWAVQATPTPNTVPFGN